jgi:hypothetical protein
VAYTVDWDQTSTFVREKIIPKVKDQYFKSNALMYRLRPKAEVFTGGRNIVQPLSFAPEGGGGQWWSGSDRFDLRIRNPITAAQFWAKNYELPIVIDQDEEDTVDGPEKLMDLISVKTKIAQRTVMDALGGPNGIYNAGTNPKAITGLDYALPSGISARLFPAGYTYGGIPSTATAYTWWNPQCDATAYATAASGSTGSYLRATNWGVWDNMLAAQALASGKTCSMILCNWGVFNEGAGLIAQNTTWFRPQQRSDLAQAGINSFMYRNKDVVVDEQVPRATPTTTPVEKVYFIDEECCHLWVHAKRNFAFEGWRQLVDQAIRVAYIWFRGELTFDERRSSGSHSTVTTTATSPV